MEAMQTPSPGVCRDIKEIYEIYPGFDVNFFYCEDFMHLYDELFTSGKISSRSWTPPSAYPPG
jgi:hypothetical protein